MMLRRGTYVKQTRPADLTGVGGRTAKVPLIYEAFVPAPVHNIELTLSDVAAADVADAEVALSRLHAQSTTSGLEALSRSLMRSEAVASSWIEALRVSHCKLAEAQQEAPGSACDEARRVLGNIRAMDAAVRDRDRAGTFRTEPVSIGGITPRNAEYVGPPYETIDALVDDLVAFINHRRELSPTVVAAVAHA